MPNFLKGARPTARHKLAAAMPHRILGATPPQVLYKPSKLSMWLNDTYGDCVTAEEAFALAAASSQAGAEVFVPDADVEAWAKAHGVLNGAEILQVIQWRQTDPFVEGGAKYLVGTPKAVDYTNEAILQNALASGPVKIGVAAAQLQDVPGIGQKNGWFASGFANDPNLDHCISVCGFGPAAWVFQQLGVPLPSGLSPNQIVYVVFSWGTIGIITFSSLVNITGEAWLRTPTAIGLAPGPQPNPNPTPSPTPSPSGSVSIPSLTLTYRGRALPGYGTQPVQVPIPTLKGNGAGINWGQLVAQAEAEIKVLIAQYGPQAEPYVEQFVASLNLSPMVTLILDQIARQLLGHAAAA